MWTRLKTRLPLAYRIFCAHPTMPATAFWRIYEAEVICRGLGGEGRGLDLGCGDGSFAAVLFPAAPGLRWCGLEQDEVDAALARRSRQYDEVQLVRGEDMPYKDSSFDIVFSNCVLEHVGGLDAVLGHVGRVLKPGGQFIFTVPSDSFYAALCLPRILSGLGLPSLRERYIQHLARRLEIVNLLSSDEWRARLQANGLNLRTEVPYAPRGAASWWEVLATLTGGLAYCLARRRTTPRKIQQASGLVNAGRGWLGAMFYVLLLPVILLTTLKKDSPPYAGRFVVAVKGNIAR